MMNAGRELDALVAEKVMGWEFKPFYNGGGDWICNGKKVAFGGFNGGSLPFYSTDIAAAWAVVEKLGMVTIENASRTGPWNVGFVWHSSNGNPYWVHAEAPTCPLAICLAALKAVGVEVDK